MCYSDMVTNQPAEEEPLGIAIIGISCRVPGADNIRQFWDNLSNSVESISFFEDKELLARGLTRRQIKNPLFVAASGQLNNIDLFDASFFGFTPREAELLDPQHRLLLECSYEALEDSGYVSDSTEEKTGVFIGVNRSFYFLNNLLPHRRNGHSMDDYQLMISNEKDFAATQIAFRLNLKGPAISINTACSTSLVAVNQACLNLFSHECDLALAGGCSVRTQNQVGQMYQDGGIASPDGHCRTFDYRAQGTVSGDGLGLVVMKRLAEAIEDGDHIYAVIKGTAINNDGSEKGGFTAPGVQGQVNVIADALAMAEFDGEDIGYVEAHGTGTTLGDPIEVTALTEAFRLSTDKKGYCALGSVKPNIGHLDTAAGIAGLIKTTLSLKHKQIVPTLHFERPNPRIDFESSPFFVNTELREWETNGKPRRAGVSSFGIGGTNAHAVLEEAPPSKTSSTTRPQQLILLSAKSESALDRMSDNLACFLTENKEVSFADLAYTLQVGRRSFPHRQLLCCENAAEAVEQLTAKAESPVLFRRNSEKTPPICFMFPDQSSQFPNTFTDLYKKEPIFREALRQCARLVESEFSLDLIALLYPEENRIASVSTKWDGLSSQTALFSIEYALASLWKGWGIEPTVMIGHGLGEYVVASLAGVFSLDDALMLVGKRGLLKDGLYQDFETQLTRIDLNAPDIPFVSCITGNWILKKEATSPSYWSRHLRETNCLSQNIDALVKENEFVILEVGPRSIISPSATSSCDKQENVILHSDKQGQSEKSDYDQILKTLGELWLCGISPDWEGFYQQEKRGRIPLPTYSFDRQQHWIAPPAAADFHSNNNAIEGKNSNLAEWFYTPSWKRSYVTTDYVDSNRKNECWMVFMDSDGIAEGLLEFLKKDIGKLVTVTAGESFESSDHENCLMNPLVLEEYDRLGTWLKKNNVHPDRIIHLWSFLDPETLKGDVAGSLEKNQYSGFWGLLSIVRSLSDRMDNRPFELRVVTNRLLSITGEEGLLEEKSTILGACRSIPLEFTHVSCANIDFNINSEEGDDKEIVIRQLHSELMNRSPETSIAFRGKFRWTPVYLPLSSQEKTESRLRLKDRGVYLITGGLGKLGLIFAEYLTKKVCARLILTGRSEFPPKEQWESWLLERNEDQTICEKIKILRQLEKLGTEITVIQANVADARQMKNVLTEIKERYGQINGIVHGAGIVGNQAFRLIENSSLESCNEQFQAKVKGVVLLEELLKNEPLDFCLLLSSLVTILGGVGSSIYGAANRFMDSFAINQREKRPQSPWMSVNWDFWNLQTRSEEKAPNNNSILKYAINREEAEGALDILFANMEQPQLVVSTGNLQRRIQQWVNFPGKNEDGKTEKTSVFPSRDYHFESRDELEQTITAIWEEILGIDHIGIHDSFFDLGGSSLAAIQFSAIVQEKLKVRIPLNQLFELKTVADIAVFIEEANEERNDEQLPILVNDLKNRDLPFPLTAIQQAYWMGRNNRFELGNVGTYLYIEIDFTSFNLEQFETAWNKLIKRHEMLRAVVLAEGEQKILPETPEYLIEQLDLRGQNREQCEKRLLDRRSVLSHRLLDTTQWPLFEIKATLLPNGITRLHLGVDLLIADGWSFRVLNRDLVAFLSDRDAELPTLDVSFRDYVLTEQALKESTVYRKSREYWMNRLENFPKGPEIPLVSNPSSIEKPKFFRRTMTIGKEPWQILKKKASTQKITPSVIILTAFGEVLNLWSKTSRFAINMTLFNRLPLHPKINEILGDFTSLTLLEMDFQQKASFSDRLLKVQKQLWSDLGHKYFSGVELLRELSRYQKGENRVFMPVVFTSELGNQSVGNRNDIGLDDFGEFRGETVYSIAQTPQTWIDHKISEMNGELRIVWDSVEELFPEGMLEAMFRSFEMLLQLLIADDSVWDDEDIELLPKDQSARRQEVNSTSGEVSDDYLHTLFMKQAALSGKSVAVKAGDFALDYDELHHLSKLIGHSLQALGTKPNKLVAIVMNKGWEQIPAVLGVLMAGGAYLPIDGSQPKERIWQLLEAGKVEVVLAQQWLKDRFDWPERINSITVDLDLLQEPIQPDLPVSQTIDDLAYVIFTSGSTGEPKGVMISHRAVVNTINDINRRFDVTSEDKVLAISSLNFDLSVYDLFGPLSVGGTIVIPSDDECKDPGKLSDHIEKNGITLWNSVPAYLQLLADFQEAENRSIPDSLRAVFMSGDWIPVSLPDRLRSLCENQTLSVTSLGGATEASIWSIFYPILQAEKNRKSIPYGKPLGNQSFHILNANMSPCPDWVTGDLYIGGIGLSDGYYGNPELTGKNFIEHPKTGERLYRTGDLGCYYPDGNIEFQGREDTQVKIQGYRIELSEIQSVMTQHDAIRDCVVLVEKEGNGGKQIIAYIIPEMDYLPKPQSDKNSTINDFLTEENENQLKQAAERLIFQMDQHGLRRFPEEENYIPFKAVDPTTPLDHQLVFFNDDERQDRAEEGITVEKLGDLLACLRQLKFEEYPLPKRYYPSAGSLYPVQTYVMIPEGRFSDIAGGIYYYRNDVHGLHPILLSEKGDSGADDAVENGELSIFLVGNRDAIDPMYGYLSDDFILLEAGYMNQLLRLVGEKIGMECSRETATPPNWLMKTLQLPPSHQIAAFLTINPSTNSQVESNRCHEKPSWLMAKQRIPLPNVSVERSIAVSQFERQSYRLFNRKNISREQLAMMLWLLKFPVAGSEPLQTILYAKRDRIEGLKEGFYYYDRENNSLDLFNDSVTIDENDYHGINRSIFRHSGFALFLVIEDRTDSIQEWVRLRKTSLIDAGVQGQNLMTYSPKFQLGLCPIGEELPGVLPLNDDCHLIHSFLGGAIDEEMKHQWQVQDREQNFEKRTVALVKEFLNTKLPHYMIPSQYVLMEQWPLTSNGKIDRKKLIPLNSIGTVQREYVPPKTEEEKRIAAAWSEIIGVEKIGMNDNFFEIGGDSVLIVQLYSKMKFILSQRISIIDLFANPTIAKLTQSINSGEKLISEQEQITQRATKEKEAIRRQRQKKAGN